MREFYNAFSQRDRICVSHYPLPRTATAPESLPHLLSLDRPDRRNRRKTIYVHIPFCDAICSFCPFNKFLKKEDEVNQYLDALKLEMNLYSQTHFCRSATFDSIYLGGGTPSCLKTDQIIDILQTLKDRFSISPNAMIFVEGNPMSFTIDKLTALHDFGVNRISVGAQTFDDRIAKNIHLPQKPATTIQMIQNAHSCGFTNVGIDLMYPLPGMAPADWMATIQQAIDLKVDHICLIAFCLVPNTSLFAQSKMGKLDAIASTDGEIEMYWEARKRLLSSGYQQYSILDFSFPGKVDEHAKIYFSEQGELLGLGAAAFGNVGNYMYVNAGTLCEYVDRVKHSQLPILVGEMADTTEEMHGFMAKGLRMLSVDKKFFKSLYRKDLDIIFESTIENLKNKNLLIETESKIMLSEKGIVWGNNVCKEFFSERYKNPRSSIDRTDLAKGKLPEWSSSGQTSR